MRQRLRSSLIAAVALVAVLSVTSPAHAGPPDGVSPAGSSGPQVGRCYDYGPEAMEELSSPSRWVRCSTGHTAEVFKVAVWPNRSPYGMTEDERWDIADKKCAAGSNSNFSAGWFDYWAYFFPRQDQWRNGQRWLRCDALKTLSTDPLRFDRWRGKRLE